MNVLDKITLLNNATLKSLDELDRRKIIGRFTETGLTILEADYGFMFWKQDFHKTYALAYVSPQTPYNPNLPRERGYNFQVEKSKKPYMGLVKREKNPTYDLTPYMKSIIIIPIFYRAKRYGNLVLCYKKKRFFTNEDRRVSISLGNAMAQAITVNGIYSNLKDFKITLDKTLDCIFMFDPKTFRIRYVNRGALEQVGYNASELHQKSFLDLQVGMEEGRFRRMTEPLKKHLKESELFETVLKTKFGMRIPVEVFLQYVRGSGDRSDRFLSIVRDITERKRAEEAVTHSAYHDSLTDLPNRALFTERLTEALKNAEQKQNSFALLFIDVDKFKFINDILGHVVGDKLLREVGQRLVRGVRKRDTVSRMGGDEFVILLDAIHGAYEAKQIADHILELFNDPFELEGQEVYINISVGVSVYPADAVDIHTLLKNADVALHMAKEEGGATVRHFYPGIAGTTNMHLEVEKQLRSAIKYNQLVLYYQPQVNLESGEVCGVEALLRWKHPTLGLIYPNDFIARAEESGIIVQMGEWVYKEAIKQNKSWQDMGLNPIPISVNLSPRQLLQPNLVSMVTGLLKDTGLANNYFQLELTESVIMKNVELSISILEQFRSLGIKCLIDDFGTGYASLSYLKRLPVDIIKIDRSFVQGSSSVHDAAIIKAIVSLARQMQLGVIAEGVETSEQIEFLRSINCDIIQGNLYSRPLPSPELTKLLRKPRLLSQQRNVFSFKNFRNA